MYTLDHAHECPTRDQNRATHSNHTSSVFRISFAPLLSFCFTKSFSTPSYTWLITRMHMVSMLIIMGWRARFASRTEGRYVCPLPLPLSTPLYHYTKISHSCLNNLIKYVTKYSLTRQEKTYRQVGLFIAVGHRNDLIDPLQS